MRFFFALCTFLFTGAITPDAAFFNYTGLSKSDLKAEQQMDADYAQLDYSLAQPFIKRDPYQKNPLSAIVRFKTLQPATITVTVKGIKQVPDLKYTINDTSPRTISHIIPVLGLFPNTTNTVELTAHFADGATETSSITIKTDPLTDDIFYYPILKKDTENRFYTSTLGGSYIYDEYGYIRLNFKSCYNTYFYNNHIIEEFPRNGIVIYNLLGKLVGSVLYPRGFRSFEHDISFLPNGNILAIGSKDYLKYNLNGKHINTAHDIIFEINATGELVKMFDLGALVNIDRPLFRKPSIEYNAMDWAHANSVKYDAMDDSLIISAKHHGLLKVDYKTGQLKWIITPHLQTHRSGRENLGPDYSDKVLTAVDATGTPLSTDYQIGAVRDNTFKYPVLQHDMRQISDNLFSVFSNNGYVFDKSIQSSPTSDILVYQVDQAKNTVQLKDTFEFPDATLMASSAVFLPKQNQAVFFFSSILDKNTLKTHDTLRRIDTTTKDVLFQAILKHKVCNKIYHYRMEPFDFPDTISTKAYSF